MQLVCKNCGATLKLVDRTHAVCPYCGQTFLIDEARGVLVDLSISYDDNAVTRRKMRNVKWLLLIFLLVGAFFAAMIFAYNIAAKNSKFSASDLYTQTEENGQILRVFCKDIFGKEYRDITKEEFAQIKYIRYAYAREDNDSLMAIHYSFTNYEDCASEEEFLDTIQVWTYQSDGMLWPSDFTMFTGLTRINMENSIWLSQLRFSKKAPISYVQADDTIETISKVVNPEYVKILHIKNGQLEKIDRFPNLVELTYDTNLTYQTMDISELENCTKLKYLYLNNVNGYTGYDALGNLKELETLYVSNLRLSQCDFLSELPQLKELIIAAGENADLTVLTKMPHLRKLIFMDNEYVAPEELAKLQCLTELEELEVNVDNEEAFRVLQKFKNLKVLSVDGCFGTIMAFEDYTFDISIFCQLPALEKLVFDNWHETNIIGIEKLLSHPQFYSLQIGSRSGQCHTLLLDETALIDNPSMTDIRLLNCVPVDIATEEEIGFEFLTHYSNLQKLYIEECELENIAFISDLTDLRICSLRENKISNFSALQACKKLEALDVYDNPYIEIGLPEEIILNDYTEDLW